MDRGRDVLFGYVHVVCLALFAQPLDLSDVDGIPVIFVSGPVTSVVKASISSMLIRKFCLGCVDWHFEISCSSKKP